MKLAMGDGFNFAIGDSIDDITKVKINYSIRNSSTTYSLFDMSREDAIIFANLILNFCNKK